MKVGCVKEIQNNEFRVGLTPDNVKAYVAAGHEGSLSTVRARARALRMRNMPRLAPS